MNVEAWVTYPSARPEPGTLWAHIIFMHCEGLVFVAVELKDPIGPVWVGMFDTFRDAFDFGVQRGFIAAQHLTLSREEIIGPDKPALAGEWIPFKKELVAGLIPGQIMSEQ